MELEKYERKAVSDKLKKYDYLAEESSFIEVTEWNNGEGYDIVIDDKRISLSIGEIEAINYLTKTLEFHSK